jgi:hypothetical protein
MVAAAEKENDQEQESATGNGGDMKSSQQVSSRRHCQSSTPYCQQQKYMEQTKWYRKNKELVDHQKVGAKHLANTALIEILARNTWNGPGAQLSKMQFARQLQLAIVRTSVLFLWSSNWH